MEYFFITFILTLLTFAAGMKTHAYYSIDYKTRWIEAISIIKNEKLNTEELKQIGPPQNLPERLKDKPFVESCGPEFFKNLTASQRERMEMLRLEEGLEPKDSMGGADGEEWTRVRMAWLKEGWEHWSDGWYKIK